MRVLLFNVCLFGILLQCSESFAVGSDDSLLVTGQVLDSSGNPVCDAWVRASRIIGGFPTRYDADFVVETRTDNQGCYGLLLTNVLSAKPIRHLVIGAGLDDGRLSYRTVSIDEDESELTVDLTFKLTQPIELEIIDHGGQPIRDATLVRLIESRDGKNATVWDGNIIKLSSKQIPTSDGNGQMQIPFASPADSFQVVVQHKDFATERVDRLKSSETPTEIVMELGRKIEFQLIGNHGSRVFSEAIVSLRRDNNEFQEDLAVNSAGRGYFRLKSRQSASLTVIHPMLQVAPATIRMSESHDRSIYEFRLERFRKSHELVADNSRD